jgi:hypothetical protein
MSEDSPIYGKPSPADMADAHHRRWVDAGAPAHGISNWIPADKEVPSNPRCVLATDGEAHFIACWQSEWCEDFKMGWSNAHTSEEIDSVVTYWMELPEVPE